MSSPCWCAKFKSSGPAKANRPPGSPTAPACSGEGNHACNTTFSDFARKGYWERIDILADAIYEIFAPIEAVAMTTEEWDRGDSLIAAFARKGEVLYTA